MIVVLLVLILFALLFPGVLRFIIGAVALLFAMAILFGPVKAQDAGPGIPQFDPNKVCHRQFDAYSSNPNYTHFINACVDKEQNGYDYLKFSWLDVSSKDRSECIRSLSFNNNPDYKRYSLLASCIQPFYDAAQRRNEKPRSFVP